MSKVHDHYAFPHDPEIESVMRFGSVKRWHMLDTTKIQTLAEHSANVALLAHVIAYTAPGMHFGPSRDVALYALLHDIAEVFTGDIPTPTKRHLVGLDALETKVVSSILRWEASEDIRIMVKLCDLADGIRFIRLHGVGPTGRHAMEGLIEQFDVLAIKAVSIWPPEVLSHVIEKAWFYAHEAGVEAAQGVEDPYGGPMAPDLARGQGDITGSPGPVIRDVITFNNPSYEPWLRNRMAGTKSQRHSEDPDDNPFF